ASGCAIWISLHREASAMRSASSPARKLLTTAATAELLGVDPSTIMRWVNTRKPGFPRPLRHGPRCRRFYLDEVEAFLNSCRQEAAREVSQYPPRHPTDRASSRPQHPPAKPLLRGPGAEDFPSSRVQPAPRDPRREVAILQDRRQVRFPRVAVVG